MNRITKIETLEYFENHELKTRHGVFQCKFRGENKFFVLSNNIVYVIVHYSDKSELNVITNDVKKEFFELIGINEV